LLGSVPAASWAYSSAGHKAIAAGVGGANVLAALLAAMLPETTGVQLATLSSPQPTVGPRAAAWA